MEQDYIPLNPRMRMRDLVQIGQVVQDADLADEATIATNPAYQELLIPAGVGQFAGTILSRSKDHVVALGIARPYEDGPFEPDVIRTFSDIVQSAIPVVHLAERILDTRALSLLDLFGPDACVAVLDRDGTLLRHSGPFERLLSAGTVRRDRFGRLDLLADDANRHLAQAIHGDGATVGGRFSFTRLRPECTYICTVSPVPPLGGFGARSGHAVIVVDMLSSPKVLDRSLLSQVASLTEAECDVCECLYAGNTVSEIAEIRAVANSTIKSLLKSIMMKLGARRQAEVVIKLSRFAF